MLFFKGPNMGMPGGPGPNIGMPGQLGPIPQPGQDFLSSIYLSHRILKIAPLSS